MKEGVIISVNPTSLTIQTVKMLTAMDIIMTEKKKTNSILRDTEDYIHISLYKIWNHKSMARKQ